jgi:DNA-binding NarL/FixJ family response regulator
VVAHVTDVDFALELGLVAAWGDGTAAARRWCERAQHLVAQLPGDDARRSMSEHGIRRLQCTLATMDADLDTAMALIESTPMPQAHSAGARVGAHVAYVMTRSLLATRHPRINDWIERICTLDESPMAAHVIVPTLRAWSEWLDGNLDVALDLSGHAVEWLDAHHVDAHHWGFDTYITAGWCRLSSGDFEGARQLARRGDAVAEAIPCAWNRLQAAFLTGRVALASGDARDALRIVEDVRSTVPFENTSGYADRLIHLAAEAAIAMGRIDLAAAHAADLPPGPHLQLIRARIEPLSDARLDAVLADRDTWSKPLQIQAGVILATRSHSVRPAPELVALVESAAATGWVLPFLELGPRAERALRSIPLARLHPRLDAALEATVRTPPSGVAPPKLTNRELSLLELLPTHLSYAEIGERTFLSVNTVKSSLKGLYRKLDAHTRAEAVAAGQAHGLI